jgi:hypothetical protein
VPKLEYQAWNLKFLYIHQNNLLAKLRL